MATVSSLAGILEIFVFLLAVAAFIAAVRFFVASRKRLNETFPGLAGSRRLFSSGFDRDGFWIPRTNSARTAQPAKVGTTVGHTTADPNRDEINLLRRQLQQQQEELKAIVQTVSRMGGQTGTAALKTATFTGGPVGYIGEKRFPGLAAAGHKAPEQPDAYTLTLQQQFEEVQTAFDEMQDKMAEMEKHAWQVAELNMQLEQATQSAQEMQTTLVKKDEKLRELIRENKDLYETCRDLESKLAAASQQQQQLLRKVHLLEGLNADMLQMAEAARKLKAGMSRAAELESMLQTIASAEPKDPRTSE